eukprot:TRINITY_DN3745_c0_g2_i1.p2 TRINITY_DN3745_c0_g2~~TRINITY_DN3745_c0_g2_i1.p2  ORF type:complete len:169 (+),score=61.79 TRINITY_DN3745_c0_g2_i1:71-508(+)
MAASFRIPLVAGVVALCVVAVNALNDGTQSFSQRLSPMIFRQTELLVPHPCEVFLQIDTNGDALLEPEEQAAFIAKWHIQEGAAVLNKVDSNGDGFLSQEEFDRNLADIDCIQWRAELPAAVVAAKDKNLQLWIIQNYGTAESRV